MKQRFQSFANRLTRKVLVTVLLIMLFTLTMTFIAAYRGMRGEIRGRYLSMMNVVAEKIQLEVKTMEIEAMNVSDEVERHLAFPETVMTALEKELRLNNFATGYFAAFEPGYFPEKGKWFEPHVYKGDDGSCHSDQVGSERHDYLKSDWYVRAKKEGTGFWTDPYLYRDESGNGGVFCTFVMPIRSEDGHIIGVCGADLLLDNLINDLQKIDDISRTEGMQNIDQRYNHLDFYSFIINNEGTYIAHPDKERVLKENIMSHLGKDFLTIDNRRIVGDMMQMKNGIETIMIDSLFADIYFTPVESTNWVMAIVVPKKALFQPILLLLFSLLSATGLGQILVWLICRRHIRKITKPLVALTQSTDEVAKGNFQAPLPQLEYHDEISVLRDSVATMQHSLVQYIKDLEETTAKKTAIESELNVARKIQMAMIPNKFPPFRKRQDIDIYGSLTPAKAVGGDLFDFFIRDERLFFCIGDVSGKGVPASLMMTVVHYLFRSISTHFDEPKRIVEIMNDCLAADNKSLMFCTFFLGVLDLKTGQLVFCNAGHEAPYMITSGVERIAVDANMALGVMEGMSFTTQEIQLPANALLLLYTDGVTEAMNPEKVLFGKERIEEALRQALKDGTTNAAGYVGRMTDEVAAFVKEAPQADDLTMLALGRLNKD